jgi:hypothetical protein
VAVKKWLMKVVKKGKNGFDFTERKNIWLLKSEKTIGKPEML